MFIKKMWSRLNFSILTIKLNTNLTENNILAFSIKMHSIQFISAMFFVHVYYPNRCIVLAVKTVTNRLFI